VRFAFGRRPLGGWLHRTQPSCPTDERFCWLWYGSQLCVVAPICSLTRSPFNAETPSFTPEAEAASRLRIVADCLRD